MSPFSSRDRWYSRVVMAVFAAGLSSAASAAESAAFVDAPLLKETGAGAKTALFATRVGPAARRTFDLTVGYIDSHIENPARAADGTPIYDPVHLRGYSGPGTDPSAPYVAPTIEVTPGQRVSITLHNKLPDDPSCASHMDNQPHCFNGTNLHSHGLWVSPAGNSDNVLLSIDPGQSFTYEYDLPDDHPSGTFWYHTHRHGSTALQVSSGMAGALIVRGDRLPTPTLNGDIDTLLKTPDGKPFVEHTLVLQQIAYACRTDGKIDVNPDGTWRCASGQVGTIENYDQFGPGVWATSGRFTTINGLMRPQFTAVAGEPQHWRLIHGGVRDTVTLGFRRRDPAAPVTRPTSLAAAKADALQNCTGPLITSQMIAADGLTMGAVQGKDVVVLQPGYRADLLMILPEKGLYCVTNESAPASGSVSGAATDRQLIGTVFVAGGRPTPDPAKALTEILVASAKALMPADVKASIIADLEAGLKLTRFVPHPDISADEVNGTQELTFFIDLSGTAPKFEVANALVDPKTFDPNHPPAGLFASYEPGKVNRLLPLGGVQQWTLQSAFVSHPFHIHVNPFQIVEILNPEGVDVSAPGAVDKTNGVVDPEYAGLKGVWKDTIWVKNNGNADLSKAMYTIRIRTRYQRYIGEYVLHCHILDHEDQGMMQNVCIDLPNGSGNNCSQLTGAASHASHMNHTNSVN